MSGGGGYGNGGTDNYRQQNYNTFSAGGPSQPYPSTPYPRSAPSNNTGYNDPSYSTSGNQRPQFSPRGSYEGPPSRESATLTSRGGPDPTSINKERKHECRQCGKRFERPSAVVTHMRSHTGEKPFPCNFCEKSFSINSNRLRHQKTYHTTLPHTTDPIQDEEGYFHEDYSSPIQATNAPSAPSVTSARGLYARDGPTYGGAGTCAEFTSSADRLLRLDINPSQSYNRNAGSASGSFNRDYLSGGGGGGTSNSYLAHPAIDSRPEYSSDQSFGGRPTPNSTGSYERDRYNPPEGVVGTGRDRSASGSSGGSYGSSGLGGYSSNSSAFAGSPTSSLSSASYYQSPHITSFDTANGDTRPSYSSYSSSAVTSHVRGGETDQGSVSTTGYYR